MSKLKLVKTNNNAGYYRDMVDSYTVPVNTINYIYCRIGAAAAMGDDYVTVCGLSMEQARLLKEELIKNKFKVTMARDDEDTCNFSHYLTIEW